MNIQIVLAVFVSSFVIYIAALCKKHIAIIVCSTAILMWSSHWLVAVAWSEILIARDVLYIRCLEEIRDSLKVGKTNEVMISLQKYLSGEDDSMFTKGRLDVDRLTRKIKDSCE